jgi:hypothetical protein
MAKRYQRGNQKPYIEEEQTMAKRKSTKEQKQSTKHTHKTKDRVTSPPFFLKYMYEVRSIDFISVSTIFLLKFGTNVIILTVEIK